MDIKYKAILFLVFISNFAFCQKGYYVKDSVFYSNVNLINSTAIENSNYCQVRKKGKVERYTPYQVKEYGFRNGNVYISKEINKDDSLQKVFLERLVDGEIKLFFLKKQKQYTFYLELDNRKLVEIAKNKDGYKTQLEEIFSDSPEVLNNILYIEYNRRSFISLIRDYNKHSIKAHPFFKYGAITGTDALRLIGNNSDTYMENFNFTKNYSICFGILIDKPINYKDLSFHAEILFSKHSFSYYYYKEKNDFDLLANLTSFTIPLMLRYTIPTLKMHPFINVGGVFLYHIENNCNIYNATIDTDKIIISRIYEDGAISSLMGGFAFGGGVEVKLKNKTHMSFEYRFSTFQNLTPINKLTMQKCQALIGIYF